MPVLTAYFALAGVLPFSIALAGCIRALNARLRQVGRGGPVGLAITLAMVAALAAIDTGFIALAVRSAALALHPPG